MPRRLRRVRSSFGTPCARVDRHDRPLPVRIGDDVTVSPAGRTAVIGPAQLRRGTGDVKTVVDARLMGMRGIRPATELREVLRRTEAPVRSEVAMHAALDLTVTNHKALVRDKELG